MSKRKPFAQGPVSTVFKDALRMRIKSIESNEDLESLLNDVHDAVLYARKESEGLKVAAEVLKTGTEV